MEKPVSPGQKYRMFISDLGVHGEGIGKINGFTVFVPGAIPQETVSVRVISVKRTYAIGVLNEVIAVSPDRVVSACPVYGQCGGCQISHLSYQGQLKAKEKYVRDCIERIGGAERDLVCSVLPAKYTFRYRNKTAAPIGMINGKATVGYYRQGTHDIISIDACAIQKEAGDKLFRFIRDFLRKYGLTAYDERTKKGVFRHVVGRVGDKGALMAIILTATDDLPREKELIAELRQQIPEATSLYHGVQKNVSNVILGDRFRLLWGAPALTATLCGLQFSVSPRSFFQVHKEQAEALYMQALSFAKLTKEETVIDAYCGTGTISLCLAKQAKRVIGIEIVKASIEDAKENSRRNGITNVEFMEGDAAFVMPRLYQEGVRAHVVVMDPVRAGCAESVLQAAAAMRPKKIVYISCNPATLARDVKRLSSLGYDLRIVRPVDMFPQTMHVECVCLMSRKERAGEP